MKSKVTRIILINFLLSLLCINTLWAKPPFSLPNARVLNQFRGAIIETTKGPLYLRLYPKLAPWHVANFKYLSDQGYYNNSPFHIFKKNYLAQTGSANRNPASGPPYTIPAEFNSRPHVTGALSMVRKPDFLDLSHTRNSHGSQFRILLADSPHLNGQFTIFAQVIKGFAVLNRLTAQDKIKSITVFKRR